MNIRDRVLARPSVYRTFKRIVLPSGALERVVANHYTVPDGAAVLDLGCGFGDYARFFSQRCTYVGIDHNADYIDTARRLNNPGSGIFLVADVTDDIVEQHGPFDLVMISGVLHHLADDVVEQLAENVAGLLKPGGRFVAIEPVFDPEQRLTARLLIAADRGRHVRDSAGYRALLASHFGEVDTMTATGLLRIPYTHLVITATSP